MAFQVGGNILILLIGHPGGEKKHLRIEKQTFRGMPCIFNCILTIACASFMMKLGKNIFCFLDNDIRQTNVWYSTGSIQAFSGLLPHLEALIHTMEHCTILSESGIN